MRKNDNPLVSIIVPIYNVEAYLEKCIKSIIEQSYKNIEIILVDDGSPDRCPAICDDYAQRDDRIKVIHKKNGGLSDARNAGIDFVIKQGISEWITFVDSDDYIAPEYVQVLLHLVLKHNVKCSMCGFCVIPGRNIDKQEDELIELVVHPDEMFQSNQFIVPGVAYVSSCMKLFHISLFQEVRFPIGRLHEDRFTTHKLLFQCDSISITSKKLYMYYQSEQSIMRSAWTPKRMDDFDAFEEQLKFFRAGNYTNAFRFFSMKYIDTLNGHLNDIKRSPEGLQYYKKKLRNKLKERIRIARRQGQIDGFFHNSQYYYNLYPVIYLLFNRAMTIPRLIYCKEYRIQFNQKFKRFLNRNNM